MRAHNRKRADMVSNYSFIDERAHTDKEQSVQKVTDRYRRSLIDIRMLLLLKIQMKAS